MRNNPLTICALVFTTHCASEDPTPTIDARRAYTYDRATKACTYALYTQKGPIYTSHDFTPIADESRITAERFKDDITLTFERFDFEYNQFVDARTIDTVTAKDVTSYGLESGLLDKGSLLDFVLCTKSDTQMEVYPYLHDGHWLIYLP